ncbi:MAG: tetratricopeptide repeat protein [Planctomycetota bacterium]
MPKDRPDKLDEKPKDAAGWVNRGVLLSKSGLIDDALGCFDNALETDPNCTSALVNKAIIFDQLGMLEEELECYELCLKISPDDNTFLFNKASLLSQLGRLDEALLCYEEFVKRCPDDASGWYNKGVVLSKQGQEEVALFNFEKSLALNPKNASAWYNKGVALGNLNKVKEALECFEKAISLDKTKVKAWYNKGISLSLMDCPQEALEAFKEAINLDPLYTRAWYNIGFLNGKLGAAQKDMDGMIETPIKKEVVREYTDRAGKLIRETITFAYDKPLRLKPPAPKDSQTTSQPTVRLAEMIRTLRSQAGIETLPTAKEVSIQFLMQDQANIRTFIKNDWINLGTFTSLQLGLQHSQSERPLAGWYFLRSLANCQGGGLVDFEGAGKSTRRKQSDAKRQQVKRLNRKLKELFGISDNALVYDIKSRSYKSNLRLIPARDASADWTGVLE